MGPVPVPGMGAVGWMEEEVELEPPPTGLPSVLEELSPVLRGALGAGGE